MGAVSRESARRSGRPPSRGAPARPRAQDPLAALRAQVARTPADHAARLKLAKALLRIGDLVAAQGHLEALAKVPAQALRAATLLCRLHRSVNRLEEALRWGRRAVRRGPRDPDAHAELGRTLLAARKRSAAEEQLRIAVRLAPRRAALLSDLGRALVKHHKNREAVRVLRQAASLAPRDPRPRVLLGNAFWAMSLHKRAAAAYREAVALPGGAPVFRAIALDKLGALWAYTGHRSKAHKVLVACRRLFPFLGCPYTAVALMPANPIKVPGMRPAPRR